MAEGLHVIRGREEGMCIRNQRAQVWGIGVHARTTRLVGGFYMGFAAAAARDVQMAKRWVVASGWPVAR